MKHVTACIGNVCIQKNQKSRMKLQHSKTVFYTDDCTMRRVITKDAGCRRLLTVPDDYRLYSNDEHRVIRYDITVIRSPSWQLPGLISKVCKSIRRSFAVSTVVNTYQKTRTDHVTSEIVSVSRSYAGCDSNWINSKLKWMMRANTIHLLDMDQMWRFANS